MQKIAKFLTVAGLLIGSTVISYGQDPLKLPEKPAQKKEPPYVALHCPYGIWQFMQGKYKFIDQKPEEYGTPWEETSVVCKFMLQTGLFLANETRAGQK